jgi:hypothetical protein
MNTGYNVLYNKSSDDDWDKDDFDSESQQPIKLQNEKEKSIHSIPPIESFHSISLTSLTQTTPLNPQEVEVKYPSGIVPRSNIKNNRQRNGNKLSSSFATNDSIEKAKSNSKDCNLDENTYIKQAAGFIAKIKQEKMVQGSRENILKNDLVIYILSSISTIIKNTEFIKFSQNWERKIFRTETYANINKKTSFNYNNYYFDISKTMHELCQLEFYLVKVRDSDKISIILKQGSEINDLTYTLYKCIIYIISNRKLDEYNIFKMISMLFLLKKKDPITLEYILL